MPEKQQLGIRDFNINKKTCNFLSNTKCSNHLNTSGYCSFNLCPIKDEILNKFHRKLVGFKVIDEDNMTIGECGWNWNCLKCNNSFCSGCSTICERCFSREISLKDWKPKDIDLIKNCKQVKLIYR